MQPSSSLTSKLTSTTLAIAGSLEDELTSSNHPVSLQAATIAPTADNAVSGKGKEFGKSAVVFLE